MPAPERLKKRREFLRLTNSPHKAVTQPFIVVGLPREEEGAARVGFTVTKKIGNAVIRNRIRRRLREAVRAEGEGAKAAWDYIFIARKAALLCDYPALLRDVRYGFRKLGKNDA